MQNLIKHIKEINNEELSKINKCIVLVHWRQQLVYNGLEYNEYGCKEYQKRFSKSKKIRPPCSER